jgi:porphobilinogen synthase
VSRLLHRPRRLRQSRLVRDLVHEIDLSLEVLIQPYFLAQNIAGKQAIDGFTEVYRWDVPTLLTQVEKDLSVGVKKFLLFGAALEKDEGPQLTCSPAWLWCTRQLEPMSWLPPI